MKLRLLAILATAIQAAPTVAAPIQDKWTAEATESRGGIDYRTLLTFTYDGAVSSFNGRAEWKVAVLCEARNTASGRLDVFNRATKSILAQGAWEGDLGDRNYFHLDPGYKDDKGRIEDPGKLEVTDKRCASGRPTVVNDLAPKAASAVPATQPAAASPDRIGNNGKKFDGYLWYHNGSDMLVDEGFGEIRYDKPKASISKVVKPGDVLFRGVFRKDGTVEGTAYAFKVGCPPAEYAVKGRYPNPVTFVNGRMTLMGPGPKFKPGSCEYTLSPASGHSKLVLDANSDV